ncbi:MAG: hypothetical protein AAB791_01780 [Patescibacteria group bacterium]
MEFDAYNTTVNGLKKEDLRPGMQVRNRITQKSGELAEKSGEEDSLAVCADSAVVVRIAVQGKSSRGRTRITTWALCNVIVQ